MRHSSTLFSQPDGCGNHAPDRSQGFCRACGYEELIFTVRVSNLHLQFSENSCKMNAMCNTNDKSLEHGWGIQIIKEVTQKYDGIFNLKIIKDKAFSSATLVAIRKYIFQSCLCE